eukprot:scaffold19084_cov64-Cyclotella_meneghiniana.AAC.1
MWGNTVMIEMTDERRYAAKIPLLIAVIASQTARSATQASKSAKTGAAVSNLKSSIQTQANIPYQPESQYQNTITTKQHQLVFDLQLQPQVNIPYQSESQYQNTITTKQHQLVFDLQLQPLELLHLVHLLKSKSHFMLQLQ